MAQNITLLGASYSDVPSVELPKTGGGTAQFDDTTIASNAAGASDITSGKLAFVNGELVTGTASGGGATLITKSITANGTYNASSDNADGYSSVTVNVSGGGGSGLVYESGTYTPVADVAEPTISFSSNHTSLPFFVLMLDTSNAVESTNSCLYFSIINWYDCYGVPILGTATTMYYAITRYGYKTSSSMSHNGVVCNAYNSPTPTATSLNYYLDTSGFIPYAASSNRYWRAGRTYKWIAVWAPTS